MSQETPINLEQPEVPIRPLARLLVLVEHSKDVCLNTKLGSQRRPFLLRQLLQIQIVAPRVAHRRPGLVLLPMGRSPYLRHPHHHPPEPGRLQCGVRGVHLRIEHVVVMEVGLGIVHSRVLLEYRVVEFDVLRVAPVC